MFCLKIIEINNSIRTEKHKKKKESSLLIEEEELVRKTNSQL